MIKSAYIHIPFCHHICHYCDFNKVFFKQQPVDEYIESLITEMHYAKEINKQQEPLKTIFIGGGTPTALSAKQLDRLLEGISTELLSTNELIEFAVEANPGELSIEKLEVLKNAGVNRLSIGVQSFDDELLNKIGRVHRKDDVFRTIKQAEQVGFDNLSLDLMYALPGQTIEQFRETLETAFTLNVKHFSAYSLIIEPKTVFYNLMQKGKLTLPPQEHEAQMYELAMEEMEKHGFKQYEISNYSIPGYESQHNLTYWNNEYYYGFGAGAHGYVNGLRTSNVGPIRKYMENIDESGTAFSAQTKVSKEEEMEEQMFLGLRKVKGVNKETFHKRFSVKLEEKFGSQIQKLVKQGLLVDDDESLFLTHKGKLLGNEVFQEFLIS
ncbi:MULTISPECIES: radical SAM family heme chaperone HemW [Bacillaceae]|uniref:radical SAM family heme chaperone HemW n=1 Tax=Bacillaceae TaxID=186817 RepID=UPI000BFD69B3|nr:MULTISPECIES: radical SAM family heme chaperone HemW [Bacillaceae]PGT82912.1 coproporphyrinogen III oxidase [Bacillus sp. AFS040349]UGB29581.1 radical SAM family heme chaperone HemW [Metabacillus sp. B2-18]